MAELREHALVIGEVTLTSGRKASYYVDAKRAILLPEGFRALGELVAAEADRHGATAVGGMTMGADPVACAALAAGAPVKAFFVRKEKKEHGLGRRIEGGFAPGHSVALLEDTVTTGGSTLQALELVEAEGGKVVRVICLVDRGEGGAQAFAERGVTLEAIYTREDLPVASEARSEAKPSGVD